jgi:hypothetical protein
MLDTTATGASFAGGQNNDVTRLTTPHLFVRAMNPKGSPHEVYPKNLS